MKANKAREALLVALLKSQQEMKQVTRLAASALKGEKQALSNLQNSLKEVEKQTELLRTKLVVPPRYTYAHRLVEDVPAFRKAGSGTYYTAYCGKCNHFTSLLGTGYCKGTAGMRHVTVGPHAHGSTASGMFLVCLADAVAPTGGPCQCEICMAAWVAQYKLRHANGEIVEILQELQTEQQKWERALDAAYAPNDSKEPEDAKQEQVTDPVNDGEIPELEPEVRAEPTQPLKQGTKRKASALAPADEPTDEPADEQAAPEQKPPQESPSESSDDTPVVKEEEGEVGNRDC